MLSVVNNYVVVFVPANNFKYRLTPENSAKFSVNNYRGSNAAETGVTKS